ncbi:uncharacterized protein OCT59_015927 [Rhizophagus irregularis]|uniref:uncharacterized protein n=1 Tax=Rhizophagus irregularis TaxID=588596 RepID=UPI003325F192|nr:hypothetical protein OCT59_015927 [Rhizophagus irregularis]
MENESLAEELWCKECDPFRMIEGWTSGNPDIDKFVKDTMYNARNLTYIRHPFLEWVTLDRFTDIKEIDEGSFSKVYSATWIDGKSEYYKNNDGSYKKVNLEPMMVVALKRLIGSQNIKNKFLSELKIHWKVCMLYGFDFYGLTKDPETSEFIMIIRFADKGNLRSILSKNFNDMFWQNKINLLHKLSYDLQSFHSLGYFHGQFHSKNILQDHNLFFISDFGLCGPSSKDNGVYYGVVPYIAPEVLSGTQYELSSDIYSFGVVMTELSTGRRPFCNENYDSRLIFAICINGLRPEFGKGTPEFYEELAYKCMNENPNERPTAEELFDIFNFWLDSIRGRKDEEECFSYKGKEIKDAFEEADKEISNISTSYKKGF